MRRWVRLEEKVSGRGREIERETKRERVKVKERM